MVTHLSRDAISIFFNLYWLGYMSRCRYIYVFVHDVSFIFIAIESILDVYYQVYKYSLYINIDYIYIYIYIYIYTQAIYLVYKYLLYMFPSWVEHSGGKFTGYYISWNVITLFRNWALLVVDNLCVKRYT